MPDPTIAPYGAWESPVSSEMLTSGALRFVEIDVDADDIYWVESRPDEAGRYAVMRRAADGATTEVTGSEHSARTLVHEYGGGALAVHDGVIYFSNFRDQRLYRQAADAPGTATPISPEINQRYADATIDAGRGRLICVAEDHRGEDVEAENLLVSVPLDGSIAEDGEPEPVHRGYDFYACPRLSPDGRRLAWICWNHPRMPWDATELWLADVAADGALINPRRVAGDTAGDVSIIELNWGADGTLYCVSDESGWWNIQRLAGDALVPVHSAEAEFGQPMWTFSESSCGVLPDGRLGAAVGRQGLWTAGVVDAATGQLSEFDTPYTAFFMVRTTSTQIVANAAGPERGSAIVAIDSTTGSLEVLRTGSSAELDPSYVSVPEPIAYPSAEGRTAHAFSYAPRNPDFVAPEGEQPPLLTFTHGGPTGATAGVFALGIQYWTTRGFAVIDVNYGGSTGYGTAYRRLLHGNWGIVDVEDCCAGAEYLVERGDVDGNRLAIRGGSAGGYTTLCSLTFRDVFNAGASHFGVSDAAALARDTHKFESRYLDSLIGPYPEREELYQQRSPIFSAERLNCPVIFLQGLEDKIVPPDQAERMVEALRSKGVPVAYIAFEGEQHGFRIAANIPARDGGRAGFLRPHLRLLAGRRDRASGD